MKKRNENVEVRAARARRLDRIVVSSDANVSAGASSGWWSAEATEGDGGEVGGLHEPCERRSASF